MPFIPRQVKPPARRVISCKVLEETATLLTRYAEFLDSTQEYVVNETLCVAFRRDKEFQAWLASSPAGDEHDASQAVARSRHVERPRP